MSSTLPCKRSGQAEAARDGRFDPGAAAAFQLHVVGCASCAREQAELQALGRALRAPESEATEATLRALRERVLASATATKNASKTEGLAGAPRRARSGWLVPAVAAAALLLGYGSARFAHRSWAGNGRGTLVVNAGVGGADWTQHRNGRLDAIELRDGTLNVAVQRHRGDPRVVVRVPEGEIEDIGTVFSVTVRAGKTTRVAVTSGRVIWKRRDATEMTLSAGMSWKAPEASVAPPTIPAMPPAAGLTAHAARPAANAKSSAAPAPAQPVATRKPHALPIPVAATAEVTGESAEDAAYLQLLALLHEHRDDEARLLAARYLKSFPNGFRRKEVAALTPH